MSPATESASTLRVGLDLAADHPALAGHFPGQPIVPGVVLLDLALLAVARWLGSAAQGEIASAKFLSPVTPGEALMLEASRQTSDGVHTVRFEIACGARKIASGVFKLGANA